MPYVVGSTFNVIKNSAGATYTVTVSTSQFVWLPVSDTFPFPRYIKLGSSTNQLSADREIIVLMKQ